MASQQLTYIDLIDAAERREATPLDAIRNLAAAIDRRFQAIEALNPVWQDQIATLQTIGLRDINDSLGPVRDELLAQAAAAQAFIDSLNSAGIGAAHVVVDPIAGLSATDAQAALVELLANVSSKANVTSPAFGGSPTTPTPPLHDSSNRVANMAAIQAAIADLVGTAPSTLDTLGEIAAALGSDANLAADLATALAGKQDAHANLAALAGIVLLSNQGLYTNAGALALFTLTAYGRSLAGAADATAARTILALGALATLSTITTAQLTDKAVTLAKMDDLAQGVVLGRAAAGGTGAPTALSAAQVKAILAMAAGDISGLGALATLSTVDNAHLATAPANTVKANITGATAAEADVTLAAFKAWLALVVADVTGAAPLASPALSGVPTAPTAALGTNTGQVATMAALQAAVAALINSAPGALDTLKELADAMGDDANFAATMTTALAGKQPLAANLTTLAALAAIANVTSLAGLTLAADRGLYATAANTLALFTLTAAARNLLDDPDAPTMLTTLGVSAFIQTMLDDADAATARATISAARSDAAQTLTGNQTIRSGLLSIDRVTDAALAQLLLKADAGQARQLLSYSGSTTLRWAIIPGTGTAESGANVGSDFTINGYDDAGVSLGTYLTITRASGLFSWIKEMQVGGTAFNFTVDPTNYDFMVDNSNARVYMGANASLAVAGIQGGAANPRLQIQGTAAAGPSAALLSSTSATAATRGVIYFAKQGAAGAAIGATDDLGSIDFQGWDGAAFQRGVTIRAVATAIASGVITADVMVQVANGAATPAEVARFKANGDFNMGGGGGSAVIDANRIFRARSYTIGTLPAASTAAGQIIYCSDLGGGGALLASNGTLWKRVGESGAATNAATASGALNWTPLTDAPTVRFTAALTADINLTLVTTGAYVGCRVRIVRTGAGAFNLNVIGSTTKALAAANTWVEYECSVSATTWVETASGSL